MSLTLENIQYCYNNLVKNPRLNSFSLGRSLGYLEAGLQQFGYLEIETIDNKSKIKTIIVKGDKWWKRNRKETIQEALIRMTKKLLTDNNLDT